MSSDGGLAAHPPNLATIAAEALGPGSHVGHLLHEYEPVIFAGLAGITLSVFFIAASRRMTPVPGPMQNLAEIAVEGLDGFITGILGPRGRMYVPFLGTLFLYIVCMNWMGMVPLLASPTMQLNTTVALASCVFITVQSTALFKLGPITYLDHLAGQPRSAGMFALAIFLFPLFVLLDVLVPPVTLSLRLFGNITGEETLLAASLNLNVLKLMHPEGALDIMVGVAAFLGTIIFRFLALLLGMIQGLVFMILSTIYILMVLPHEEHH